MAALTVCLQASYPLFPFPSLAIFPQTESLFKGYVSLNLVSTLNEHLVPIMKILWKIACFGSGSGPGGYPSHKSYRGARRKIREHQTKRYQNLVLWACPKFIAILKRYHFNNNKFITGAANFNHGRKDNF